ncbi:MAG: translation initiation factor eIF-2B [Deltaproteobacteria bacterium]|nr:translation initiation factor eIF-2B [Deltaproteobacteria bacterium]
MIRFPSAEHILRKIREDNRSGAAQLAQKGAQLLLDCLKIEKAEEIWALGKALIDAQPSMAPLVNLVNCLFAAINALEDPQAIREQGTAAVQKFLDNLITGPEKIKDHLLPILNGKKKVITHSYSSTCVEVLSNTKGIEVICPESRPLLEGLTTAKELGAKGIRVWIVVDSAAPSLMGECDAVIVGADAITPDGVVNKIGTYALALAARDNRVPFYALAGTEKFLPPPFVQALRIDEKDPKEVTQEAIPNSVVENRYFDITPLDLITGVVTQEGMVPGKEVRKHLEGIKISTGLQTR